MSVIFISTTQQTEAAKMVNKPPDPLSDQFLQAVADEDQKEAKQLLQAGADINYIDPESGENALAAVIESLSMVRFLLENGADPNQHLGAGETILDYAVTAGVIEVVKTLIQFGADVNDYDYKLGYTAVMTALCEGQIEIMKFLLKHGANPSQKDFAGVDLYELAKRFGRLDALREAGL